MGVSSAARPTGLPTLGVPQVKSSTHTCIHSWFAFVSVRHGLWQETNIEWSTAGRDVIKEGNIQYNRHTGRDPSAKQKRTANEKHILWNNGYKRTSRKQGTQRRCSLLYSLCVAAVAPRPDRRRVSQPKKDASF